MSPCFPIPQKKCQSNPEFLKLAKNIESNFCFLVQSYFKKKKKKNRTFLSVFVLRRSIKHGTSWKRSYLLFQTQELQMSCLHQGNSALLYLGSFSPGDSEARGGPDDTGGPVLSCLTPEHTVLRAWQQFSKEELTTGPSVYGKETKSGRSQGSSGAGGDGEKTNRKEKVVAKRNADSEKKSEGEKSGRGEKTKLNYIDQGT